MADLKAHQSILESLLSDTARISYCLKNFLSIRRAERDDREPEKIGKKVQPFHGWKLIEDQNHDEVAVCLLREDWGGKKAVSSIFRMADKVVALCGIEKYAWNEKWGIGRVCLSALNYSGVYYMEREEAHNPKNTSNPYYIYKTNNKKIKVDDHIPDRTHFTQFPRWTKNTDEFGNKLVRPSYPCPSRLEYTPDLEGGTIPWLDAVHNLENIRWRISKDILEWAEKLDQKASTRIIPKSMPHYAKRKRELDEEAKRINLERLNKEFISKSIWKEAEKRNSDESYAESPKESKSKEKEKKIKKIKKIKKTQAFIKAQDNVRWKGSKGFKKEKDLIAWNSYWERWVALNKIKKAYKTNRNAYEHQVREANRLKDKPFYQRVSVDYRGRLYLPNFSYQGSDFCRSVIEFDGGEVIDKNGWEHLLRHTANAKGVSLPFDATVKFGRSNAPHYIEIASDPIGHIKEIRDADKSFGFLRACLEIRDASTTLLLNLVKSNTEQLKATTRQTTVAKAKKWVKDHCADLKKLELIDTSDRVYEDEGGEFYMPYWVSANVNELHNALNNLHFASHMPVAVDQSNSAFQHIALMMNDDELAKRTNLADEDYNDIYQEIADRSPSLPKKKARKIIKLITVPWSYGAGNKKIVERIRDYRNENIGKIPYLDKLDSDGLKDLVKNAVTKLKKEFKTCVDYTNEVKGSVDGASRRNPNYIEWRTPFDFVVHQRVHEAKTPQGVVAKGFGEEDTDLKVKKPTDNVDWDRMRIKAPPNLVHSYDASLIHGSLWSERFYMGEDEDGIPTAFGNPFLENEDAPDSMKEDPKESDPPSRRGPVVTVHDSFACLAFSMDELIEDIKHNLNQIYNDFDPLKRFQSDVSATRRTIRKRRIQYKQSKEGWK